MTTPNDILIKGERHLIIHGQLGNIGAKLFALIRVCKDANHLELVGMLGEAVEELEYLKKVYPQLHGDFAPPAVPTRALPELTAQTQQKIWDGRLVVRHKLKDMRVLVDAAYLSYNHEGTIECHIKTMFDEAWRAAADEVGIEFTDDIPF